MPANLDELIRNLTQSQRHVLDELSNAHALSAASLDRYAQAIIKATEEGCSYGVQARRLGVHRESLYRTAKRYKERMVSRSSQSLRRRPRSS